MVKHDNWPIIPNIISSRVVGDTHHGIIPTNYLQGILTNFSTDIECPVSLVEFAREFGRQPIITRSKYPLKGIPNKCAIFRECTFDIFCNDYLRKIAEYILRDLNMYDSYDYFFIQEKPDKEQAIQTDIVRKELFSQTYYETDCPYLGCRKIAYPIFLYDRLAAILLTGPLRIKDDLDKIREIQRSTWVKYIDPFTTKLESNNEKKSTRRELDIGAIYDIDEYNKLISWTTPKVKILEQMFVEELEKVKNNYVSTKVKNYNNLFYSALKKEIIEPGDKRNLSKLWALVNKISDRILKDFGLRHICIFALNNLSITNFNLLPVVAFSGEKPDFIDNIEGVDFDLSKIEAKYRKMILTSDNQKGINLFRCMRFEDKLSLYSDYVRVFPSAITPDLCVVTWIRYNDSIWNPLTNLSDQRTGTYLEQSIRSFYSSLLSTYSSISAVKARNDLSKAMLIFGHEIINQTQGLDSLRYMYIQNYSNFERASLKKKLLINDDLAGYIKQISLLSDQARYLYEIPTPKKELFLAFKDILYKLKNSFRLEEIKKMIKIHIAYVDSQDQNRPAIYADPNLLELVVYNLVSNARKYCHKGSNIYVDCFKPSTNAAAPHLITVTNFGIEVDDSIDVYEFSERGHNVSTTAGVGVGLAISKRIVGAHGGTIFHSCEKLSDYNILLFQHYIENNFPGKNDRLSNMLKRLFSQFQRNGLFNEVVALDDGLSPLFQLNRRTVVAKEIFKPTFKVVFTVTIPPKE